MRDQSGRVTTEAVAGYELPPGCRADQAEWRQSLPGGGGMGFETESLVRPGGSNPGRAAWL